MRDIGSKTLPPKTLKHESEVVDTANKKKLGIAARINKSVTLDGLLPDNKLVFRNWMCEEMRAKYPSKPALWHVEKMYPLPNGTKLLVDQPEKQWEIDECTEKSKALKELGFKYVMMLPRMTLIEALQESGVELR